MKVGNEFVKFFGRIYLEKDRMLLLHRWKELSSCLKVEALDSLSKMLKKNRVLEIALSNIRYLLDEENVENRELLLKLRQKTETTIQHNWKAVSNDAMLNAIKFIDSDEKIMLIKGTAISQYYPKYLQRYQADVDVIVQNFDDIWEILEKSRSKYTFDRLKIYFETKDKYTASIDLLPINDKDPYVDIHVSPFQMWGGTEFEANLWENKKSRDYLVFPSVEDTLVMLGAHTTTQWMYRLRDINDIYILMQNIIDWEYVEELIKSNGLEEIFIVFNKQLEDIYECSMPFCAQSKSSFSTLTFMKKNMGFNANFSAIPIEVKFLLKEYHKQYTFARALYETFKNTKNMVIHDTRAFKANKKFILKKRQENQIFVLVPIREATDEMIKSEGVFLSNNFKIVGEFTEFEEFISPFIVWKQAAYHLGK